MTHLRRGQTSRALPAVVAAIAALLFVSGCASTAPNKQPADLDAEQTDIGPIITEAPTDNSTGTLHVGGMHESNPTSIDQYFLLTADLVTEHDMVCSGDPLENYEGIYDLGLGYFSATVSYVNATGIENVRDYDRNYCSTISPANLSEETYPGVIQMLVGHEEAPAEDAPSCAYTELVMNCHQMLINNVYISARAVVEDDVESQTIYLTRFLKTYIESNLVLANLGLD